MQPKIVLFDLDNTLSLSKEKPDGEMTELLSDLAENHHVALVSGASIEQFKDQFVSCLPKRFKLEKLYLFPENGSSMYVNRTGVWEVLYAFTLSDSEKEKIKNAVSDAISKSKINFPEKIYGEQLADRVGQMTFSALGQKAPLVEKEQWDPNQEKRKILKSFLDQSLPDYSVSIGGTTSIDITKKGINKAYAIKELSLRTNVPILSMLYIGDALFAGGNDEVVIQTGIKTKQVSGPEETKKIIKKLLE